MRMLYAYVIRVGSWRFDFAQFIFAAVICTCDNITLSLIRCHDVVIVLEKLASLGAATALDVRSEHLRRKVYTESTALEAT